MTIALLFKIIVSLTVFVGVISAIQAVMETRTPQGAIAWVVMLLAIPFVSVPFYWVFGRKRFQGYLREYDIFSPLASSKLNDYILSKFQDTTVQVSSYFENTKHSKKQMLDFFTGGNDVTLLKNGKQKFEWLLNDLENAKKYILIEYYIYRDDEIGNTIAEAIRRKAEQGVICRVVVDPLGSDKLLKVKEKLSHKNILLVSFSPNKGFGNYLQLNFRNHRKIVVIDGEIAYTGGINIGDEYITGGKKFSSWRDTSVRIIGPAAILFQYIFLRDLQFASNKRSWEEAQNYSWLPKEVENSKTEVLVLPTSPVGSFEYGTLFFLDLIHRAQKKIYIANAYFVPDEQFISALQLASLRGVEVKIIIPKNNDSKLVQYIAYSISSELQPFDNVDMYEYFDGFMHQKVIIIDDELTLIGTHNFDNRSLRLNFEISALIKDENFTKETTNMLEIDLKSCHKLSKDYFKKLPFWKRFVARCAHLLASIA